MSCLINKTLRRVFSGFRPLPCGVDRSTLIHWNEICVVAFCINLDCVTDLNVGLLSSMPFSGFRPLLWGRAEFLSKQSELRNSGGGGQVRSYTLERYWSCRLLHKLKIRYRLKSRLITITVAPSSRNSFVASYKNCYLAGRTQSALTHWTSAKEQRF